MSKEEITPEEEVKTTPTDGNDSDDLFDDSNDDLSDEQFLTKVNEIEGRNYKSVEDYKKTVKHRNAEFAKKGKKKETEKVTPNLAKEILFVRNPEAELVEADLQEVADAKYKGDYLSAYRNETWLKEKAKIQVEEKKRKELSEGKASDPSSKIQGEKLKINLSNADKRLMDKYGLSEEDLINK